MEKASTLAPGARPLAAAEVLTPPQQKRVLPAPAQVVGESVGTLARKVRVVSKSARTTVNWHLGRQVTSGPRAKAAASLNVIFFLDFLASAARRQTVHDRMGLDLVATCTTQSRGG